MTLTSTCETTPQGQPGQIELREARLEAGLSQKQLAKLSGISQSVISKIETPTPGRRFKTQIDVTNRLASALGLTPADIFWPRGVSILGHPTGALTSSAPRRILEKVCDRCFVALPATGVCDDCG